MNVNLTFILTLLVMTINIYLVGGSVRDKLLGTPCNDYDFAVEAKTYQEMKQFVLDNQGEIYVEKPEYTTIKAKLPTTTKALVADFVLCRQDGIYKDHRRPETITIGTILDDLQRRDFTINAMACKCAIVEGKLFINDEMLDYFGGIQHLQEKRLVCVGNTRDRFDEDALRMLRALRFSITLGFTLSDEIQTCLQDPALVDTLKYVSKDRIKQELMKCFEFNTSSTLSTLFAYRLIYDFVFLVCQFKVVLKSQ